MENCAGFYSGTFKQGAIILAMVNYMTENINPNFEPFDAVMASEIKK